MAPVKQNPARTYQLDPQAAQQIAQEPEPKPILMLSQPGIERDGTRFRHQSYIDGQWVRFYQDRPRKMLGYREQLRASQGIVRQFQVFSNSGFAYVHAASNSNLQRYAVDVNTGATTQLIDRTPAGYVSAPTNLWQMDVIFNTSGSTTYLVALATPSLQDITSDVAMQLYTGDVLLTTPLTAIVDTGPGALGNIKASGGVCCVSSFVFAYGHDGLITWNDGAAGDPNKWSGGQASQARPVGDKIVKGLPLRGQAAPAAIFWSLSSVIVATYNGVSTSNWFSFTTVSTNSSLLSANSIIEHNGVYYWATTNGFSMFSGVMQDIPNEYDKRYFIENLNFAQRQKVFAFKIPAWSEIWWCFPFGNATECNHAVIYNYEKGFWFDTPLPNSGRAAGYYDTTFHYPIMSGVDFHSDTNGYSLWQHEIGLDEVSGANPTAKAILSFFSTHEINRIMPTQVGQEAGTQSIAYSILEPDFGQTGDLFLNVTSRANPNDQSFQSPDDAPYRIPATFVDEEDSYVSFQWSDRLTSFTISSNTAGGNYVVGSPLLYQKPDRERRTH